MCNIGGKWNIGVVARDDDSVVVVVGKLFHY